MNDFIIDIYQDFIEIESILKVLKDSAYNENNECTMKDLGNTLEILIAKMTNTKNSLNKFIEETFDKQPTKDLWSQDSNPDLQ